MVEVKIIRNEVPDAAVAQRFQQEIAEVACLAGPCHEPLACAILDEGLHAEIEFELPGWTERVRLAYPVGPGEVRRAVKRLLREFGLLDDPPAFRLSEVSRGY